MSLADDVARTIDGGVQFYEGTVARLDSGSPVVDLDGWSVGTVPTSLTLAVGDAVLVAVGKYRTWIVESPDGVGTPGPTGPTGPPGATGDTGAAGTNGATWITGSGAPSGGAGAVGDYYLDTSSASLTFYKKTGSTTWTSQGSFNGTWALQLATPATRKVAFGTGTITIPSGANASGTVSVTHGLGATPVAALMQGNNSGSLFYHVIPLGSTARSSTTVTFAAMLTNGISAAGTYGFDWIAIA